MMPIFARPGLRLGTLLLAASLAACGGSVDTKPASRDPLGDHPKNGKITGEDGITLFGGRTNKEGEGAAGGTAGVGVNSFLWRASLDTLAFMPLASADPFGGVIITDWYAGPDAPSERFKITLYILDRQLRADGIKAAVFRQVRDPSGGWTDAAVDPKTATDIENAILAQARHLRVDTATASR